MTEKNYESTVMRMAGNIAAGIASRGYYGESLAEKSVEIARAIVTEVKRTEPKETPSGS